LNSPTCDPAKLVAFLINRLMRIASFAARDPNLFVSNPFARLSRPRSWFSTLLLLQSSSSGLWLISAYRLGLETTERSNMPGICDFAVMIARSAAGNLTWPGNCL
jgi:hypothetical protein